MVDYDGSCQFYYDEDNYNYDEIDGERFSEGKYMTMI